MTEPRVILYGNEAILCFDVLAGKLVVTVMTKDERQIEVSEEATGHLRQLLERANQAGERA